MSLRSRCYEALSERMSIDDPAPMAHQLVDAVLVQVKEAAMELPTGWEVPDYHDSDVKRTTVFLDDLLALLEER